MGIEKELSQMCAMIESGKLCYADAVYYLNLMRKKYGIWEKEFRQIYDVWSQKGELSGELDRHKQMDCIREFWTDCMRWWNWEK